MKNQKKYKIEIILKNILKPILTCLGFYCIAVMFKELDIEEIKTITFLMLLPAMLGFYATNIVKSIKEYNNKCEETYKTATEDVYDDSDLDNNAYFEVRKIKAYHEAGHAVIAKHLGFQVGNVTIQRKGTTGGSVSINFPSIMLSNQLRNFIIVTYAGFASEKLFLNDVSEGCVGGEDADLVTANEFIRNYIILTDEDISYYKPDDEAGFKDKCSKLSKELMKETHALVKKYESEIQTMAIELLSENK